MVGWYQNSVGYHSDNGEIYNNRLSSSKISKNGAYGKGDIVGCGVSDKYKAIYFTRNGVIEAIVTDYNKENPMHPTMTFVRERRSYRYQDTDETREPTIIEVLKESEFKFKPDFLDIELNKTVRDDIVKEEVCILCYTNKPDVLFLPCQHQACCTDCISEEHLDVCPICKQNIMLKKNVDVDDTIKREP